MADAGERYLSTRLLQERPKPYRPAQDSPRKGYGVRVAERMLQGSFSPKRSLHHVHRPPRSPGARASTPVSLTQTCRIQEPMTTRPAHPRQAAQPAQAAPLPSCTRPWQRPTPTPTRTSTSPCASFAPFPIKNAKRPVLQQLYRCLQIIQAPIQIILPIAGTGRRCDRGHGRRHLC